MSSVPLPTAYISTITELVPITLTSRSGAIILPQTSLPPGRSITFKEIQGRAFPSSIIFSTIASGQLLEGNVIRMPMSDRYGSYTFTAGSNNTWYVTGGTTMNIGSISSINTLTLSTVQLSTANTSVSTLKFNDIGTRSTQDLYMKSTFLFYGPSNLWAGTRVASGETFLIGAQSLFSPSQVAFTNLWLDAADTNTLQLASLSTPTLVSRWFDKSGRNNHATPIRTGPMYFPSILNGKGGISFGFSNSIMLVTSNIFAGYNYSMFAVGKYTREGTGQWIAGQWKNQYGSVLAFTRNGVNGQSITAATGTDNIYQGYGATLTLDQDTPHIYSASLSSAATGFATLLAGADGTLATYTSSKSGNTTATQQPFAVGGDYEGTTPYYPTLGFVNEVITFSMNLNFQECQIVEGYLAWKWGLVSNLPPTHPYKRFPPSSVTSTSVPNAPVSASAGNVTNNPISLTWTAPSSERFTQQIQGYNIYGPTGLLGSVGRNVLSFTINDIGSTFHNSAQNVGVAARNQVGISGVQYVSVIQYAGTMSLFDQYQIANYTFQTNNTYVTFEGISYYTNYDASITFSVTIGPTISTVEANIYCVNYSGMIYVSCVSDQRSSYYSNGSALLVTHTFYSSDTNNTISINANWSLDPTFYGLQFYGSVQMS